MKLLNTDEVARILRVSSSSLKLWRRRGVGPSFIRYRSAIRYMEADVEAWVNSQVVKPGEAQGTSKQVPVDGGA